MITIGREDVLQALPDVVADYGAEYIYRRTPYSQDGSPRPQDSHGHFEGPCYYVHTATMRGDEDVNRLEVGCFVGAVLNKLGVDLSEMARIEQSFGPASAGSLVAMLGRSEVAQIDMAARNVLEDAQGYSDTGSQWGEVVGTILRHYADRQDG